MKKHDEGYVLAYVTVVLLIFCLVAALILTGALRNLNHQQDSIRQMQDQYVAEGMIEQVLAQWSKCTYHVNQPVFIDSQETVVKCIAEDTTANTVTLLAQSGTVTITCVVQESDGKVLSYQIGTAEEPPADFEEVSE